MAPCIYYGNAVVYGLMQTVVETPPLSRRCGAAAREDERTVIVDTVANDPRCGVVIPGTGGVRKLRVAASGRGKRGGARVIYLLGGLDAPIFLLAIFAKNEKSDLAQRERSTLSKLSAAILEDFRRGQ